MAEVSAGQIAAVRTFNRFYTGRIGALNEGLLASPFSLTEMRVLYELAHRAGLTAAALGDDLRLDAGYLSRILRRFQARGLIAKSASAKDGRARVLSLTKKGRATFDPYDRRSSDEVAAMLADLSPADRRRLVSAMATIERLLAPGLPSRGRVVLRGAAARRSRLDRASPRRALRVGIRVGRTVRGPRRARRRGLSRAATTPARALLDRRTRRRDRGLGPARDASPTRVAKLRLLLVEPEARGLGVGRRLVEECVAFARGADTTASCSGRTPGSTPRGRSTRRPGFGSSGASRARSSARPRRSRSGSSLDRL